MCADNVEPIRKFVNIRLRNGELVLVSKECPFRLTGRWCGNWCPLCSIDDVNEEVYLYCGHGPVTFGLLREPEL